MFRCERRATNAAALVRIGKRHKADDGSNDGKVPSAPESLAAPLQVLFERMGICKSRAAASGPSAASPFHLLDDVIQRGTPGVRKVVRIHPEALDVHSCLLSHKQV